MPGMPGDDDRVLDRLLRNAALVKLERGRFVFHAGDPCRAFLILLDGEVRVRLVSIGGREVTLYRIEPGRSCILTSSCILSHRNYPAEAVAESGVEALAIPIADFEAVMESSAWFRRYVFDSFATRLATVIQKIEDIAFTSIDSRLEARLLELSDKGQDQITHHSLATDLGTAREVVSRHLRQFEADGLVALGRGRVAVTDAAGLQALVAGPSVT